MVAILEASWIKQCERPSQDVQAWTVREWRDKRRILINHIWCRTTAAHLIKSGYLGKAATEPGRRVQMTVVFRGKDPANYLQVYYVEWARKAKQWKGGRG